MMEKTAAELRKIVRDAEYAYRTEVDSAQAKIVERYRTLSLAQTEYDEAKAEFDEFDSKSRTAQAAAAVDLGKISGYFGNDKKSHDGWNSHAYFSLKKSAFEPRVEPKPNQDTIYRLSLGNPSRELLRMAVKSPVHWRAAMRNALKQAVNAVAKTLKVDVKEESVVRNWSSREWNAVRARGVRNWCGLPPTNSCVDT